MIKLKQMSKFVCKTDCQTVQQILEIVECWTSKTITVDNSLLWYSNYKQGAAEKQLIALEL